MTFLCIECGKILDEINFYRKLKINGEGCAIKKLKCQLCGKCFLQKKRLTAHTEREHQNESNSNVLEKPKIVGVNNNNSQRTLFVGSSFSGKTSLMLIIFFTTT